MDENSFDIMPAFDKPVVFMWEFMPYLSHDP